MAKELLKDSATAAVERVLQSFLPQLTARLDSLQKQIADSRSEMENRFEHIEQRFERIDQKFERQQELLNELGLRINTVASKLDVYVEVTRVTQSDVREFVERVVRVEEAQKSRRKRAS